MIDWSKQNCGVHRASFNNLCMSMPDLRNMIFDTFPNRTMSEYSWDVKVHMLMPAQYPCLPNWHYDHVPRVNNKQDFNKVRPDEKMFLWVSGEPLPEFRMSDGSVKPVPNESWYEFSQLDRHRGTMSHDFQWRGFIRATPISIIKPINNYLRLHSQVYLDAESFRW